MPYHPDIHRRHSMRLSNFDYTNAGAYFVTICTYQRECLFGDVTNGEMRLNEFGEIVREEWVLTAKLRDYITLDEFVVMPNHFHAVVMIDCCRGTARRAPTRESFGQPVVGSLATVVRSFKSAAARRINTHRITPGQPVWQRNYYEHVIRDDLDLATIRQYIVVNAVKWVDDENYRT